MTAPRHAECLCGHPWSVHPAEEQSTCQECDRCIMYRPVIGKPKPPTVPAGLRINEQTSTSTKPPATVTEIPLTVAQLIAAGKRSEVKSTVALAERLDRDSAKLRERLAVEREQAEATARAKERREQAEAAVAAAKKVYDDALVAARAARTARADTADGHVVSTREKKICPVCRQPKGNVGAHRAKSAACAITKENP